MIWALRRECGGLSVEMNQLDGCEGEWTEPSEFLRGLLEEYRSVFAMLDGLPPRREIEHSIVLKEGSNPTNIRPYRNSQAQKDEIERLMGEMMAAGIIRSSSSPFLSPVLLVKKRTGLGDFA